MTREEGLHSLGQVGPRCLDQQVQMIAEDHEGEQLPATPDDRPLEHLARLEQKGLAKDGAGGPAAATVPKPGTDHRGAHSG